MMNYESDTIENTETVNGVCMEIAGIESCGFGVGPMEIPSPNNIQEQSK